MSLSFLPVAVGLLTINPFIPASVASLKQNHMLRKAPPSSSLIKSTCTSTQTDSCKPIVYIDKSNSFQPSGYTYGELKDDQSEVCDLSDDHYSDLEGQYSVTVAPLVENVPGFPQVHSSEKKVFTCNLTIPPEEVLVDSGSERGYFEGIGLTSSTYLYPNQKLIVGTNNQIRTMVLLPHYHRIGLESAA